jgi:hypothetical protein
MTIARETTISEVESAAREILACHQSMFLATAGSAGPWASGVYFAETGLFTLSLVLERRGRTLAAIRENPVVSVVVSTGSPGEAFLQAQATAEVVGGTGGEEVRRVLVEKVPAAAPFLDTPIEAVRLTVTGWRVTDIANGWLPGRELVNSGSLRRAVRVPVSRPPLP